ncbi:MAG: hypothetical protein Q7S74_02365 [Nanoarchaeota archaeon]|nr:hypothetical protein [Nanoarchaeota archaeon]
MHKRGQFYLIAALVIVGIIASVATVYNMARSTKEDSAVYDLSDEINYEGAQVLNNGVFTSRSQAETNKIIENLTDYYALVSPSKDLLIIYGNSTAANFILYNNTQTGDIGISSGGTVSRVGISERIEKNSGALFLSSTNVKINLTSSIQYDFNLKPGQNFFIVLKKENEGEQFISVSGSNQKTLGTP